LYHLGDESQPPVKYILKTKKEVGMIEVKEEFRAKNIWLAHTICALTGSTIVTKQLNSLFGSSVSVDDLLHGLVAFEISSQRLKASVKEIKKVPQGSSLLVVSKEPSDAPELSRCSLYVSAGSGEYFEIQPGELKPQLADPVALNEKISGATLFRLNRIAQKPDDPDGMASWGQASAFGFRWFIPELIKHRAIWLEVIFASLVIQLFALAMPLFTQVIIDKVIVNRTQSTLITLMIGMIALTVFSSTLSWIRQYLVLHTGTKVDAMLGAAVFQRLLRLPPKYFQYRPTGVVTARLSGIESIREFIANAAITLILDIPFALIFLAIMAFYSVQLTLVVAGFLLVIALISLALAPVFQRRLQEQFLMGARNQAFVTERVAAMETVKSLQLEPKLNSEYREHLGSFLKANLATRQLSNAYGVAAQFFEQTMTLVILGLGAWIVMTGDLTIGGLVAFQMFASRVSQPVMRMVGTWQQFQQAKIAVDRLGDMMNTPEEIYSFGAQRAVSFENSIELIGLGFKYSENDPFVYRNVSAKFSRGGTIVIMGASGGGKSTLAKLLQGFYRPTEGRIMVGGVDSTSLAANEIRSLYGVVPQETILFSGTIFDNLQIANQSASFEQIVAACKMAEVHDVIQAMPQGYLTEIGERGVGLSGGQKQRVSIARALLKRPEILIFDEATSALDAKTAEAFASTVNSLRGKVTMIFITHMPPRGLAIDQLFELAGGTLVAHAVAKSNGTKTESTASAANAFVGELSGKRA
jgi:ATP-binding cassette, subfamily B, bacterial HlyB/CyaB